MLDRHKDNDMAELHSLSTEAFIVLHELTYSKSLYENTYYEEDSEYSSSQFDADMQFDSEMMKAMFL